MWTFNLDNESEIQSELSSSKNSDPLKIDIKLSDPLQRIFSNIHNIDELPHFFAITAANHEILKGVQSRLRKMPGTRKDLEKVEEITESTSVEVKSFKPLFDDSFLPSSSFANSVLLSVFSVIVEILLHLGISYAYHRYTTVQKRFPFRHTHNVRKIFTKPIAAVEPEEFEFLKQNLTSRKWTRSHVVYHAR